LKYIKGSPGKGLLYGHNNHTKVVCYSDIDWPGSLSDRRSTNEYCVSIGDTLISWKSKNQNVVARSNAKTGYKVMASTTCEFIWLKQLLKKLQFGEVTKMTHLYVIIRMFFMLSQIPSFRKGPKILRLITILFEKIL